MSEAAYRIVAMRNRGGARTSHYHPRRLAFAFAILAILTLPVSYRAGATAPHPHALLQLLFEASNGIPLHHHAVEHYRIASSDHDEGEVASTEMPTSGNAIHERHAPEGATMYLRSDIAESPNGSQMLQVVAMFALTPALFRMPAIPFRKLGLSTGQIRKLAGIAICPDPPPPRS